MTKHKTREDWLKAAIKLLAPKITAEDRKLPMQLEALISWPHGSKTAIGQCFSKSWTKNGTVYVTVSPTLEDPLRVLDVLLHELVHAALGDGKGHGAEFKALALAVGLEGKMRATVAGEVLQAELKTLLAKLGDYPHTVMASVTAQKKTGSKEKTIVKLVSPVNPKYKAWISPKQFEEHGAPTCPISGEPMVEA